MKGLLQGEQQAVRFLSEAVPPETARRPPAGDMALPTRLHRFADISAVEGFLRELEARPAGALVAELPRVPGARENRWAHLLSGTPQLEAPAAQPKSESDVSLGEMAALKANVARLEGELAGLRALIERICAELGISSGRG